MVARGGSTDLGKSRRWRRGESGLAKLLFHTNSCGYHIVGMKTKSAALGASTSQVEVTNISQHGFWLLLADEELFLPFSEFPWFRDVAIGKILRVESPRAGQ